MVSLNSPTYTVSDGDLVLTLQEAEEGGYIVTSPLDPELVTADPGASKEIIGRAKRQLRSSRFRPRYENGIAVENQKVRIRYLFEPEPEPDPEPNLAEASNEE